MNATELTLEQALALLHQTQKSMEPIAVFGDIEILVGRFGPYIKTKEGNYKIPRGKKPELLTEEDCKALIEAAKNTETGTKRTFRRKNTK